MRQFYHRCEAMIASGNRIGAYFEGYGFEAHLNANYANWMSLLAPFTADEKTGTYLRRVAVRAVLVDVREIK